MSHRTVSSGFMQEGWTFKVGKQKKYQNVGTIYSQGNTELYPHKLSNYVLVPADKAANNVIVVCKKYYIDTLVKELGINNINQ